MTSCAALSISTRRQSPPEQELLRRLRGKLHLDRRDRPESRLHRRWPDRLHRGRRGALYSQLLYRLVDRNPACKPGRPHPGVCPATNTTSPIPTNPTTYPPNTTANPNNTYNMFCSPDLAVTIPAAAVFLSGSPTSAYGQCPETTVKPVVNYPEATTVAVPPTTWPPPPMANTSSAPPRIRRR